IASALVRQRLRCREPNCPSDVAYVDVVASLQAIPKNGERAIVEDSPAENRDHACFSVWILSWTVHIAETQRDRVSVVHATVVGQIVLDAQFRYRVWRLRILRKGIDIPRSVEVAVQYAAGRSENH